MNYVQCEFCFESDAVTEYFQKLLNRLEYWRNFCMENFGRVQLDPVWWACRISEDKLLSSYKLFCEVWNRYSVHITGLDYALKANANATGERRSTLHPIVGK